MLFITAEVYKNVGVDVIPDNETNNYLWVKIKDAENGLRIKNMPYYIRHKMYGIFGTKNLKKKKNSM